MAEVFCLICWTKVASNRGLSRHLLNQHQLSPEEYTFKWLNLGIKPLCACDCGKSTLYADRKYKFNEYLHNHHKPTLGKNMSPETKFKISIRQKKHQQSLSKPQRRKNVKKAREGLQQRYEGVNPFCVPNIKEKIKKTHIEKYGVYPATKSQGIKEKLKLTWGEILERCGEKFEPLFSYDMYENYTQLLPFRCKIHNRVIKAQLRYFTRKEVEWCPGCASKNISVAENQVQKFLSTYYLELKEFNVRDIIPPYELDIYIPDKNIAIEFNGIYWHSEFHKPKDYHFKKFQMCEERGVHLFQIYEDEWRDKRDVWESILELALGCTKRFENFNARQLTVDDNPSVKTLRKFLDENHLQGYARASKKFVLKDASGEILFCLTLRQPFTQKSGAIEIARVCSKKHSLVRGGFSKLMKHVVAWAREQEYERILTYSDCRYSLGDAYKKYGFEFIGHTGVGYDYTDFVDRFGRFKFRAQEGKSEKLVAEESGVYRIYNAGNYAWQYLLS